MDISKMTDEEFYEALVGYRNSGVNRFAAHVGVVIDKIDAGYAEGHIDLEEHHGNPIGSIHGGCLFALADSVGGAAAVSRKRAVTTLNANINYLRAGISGKISRLTAKATEVKCGKTTSIYDVVITDDNDKVLTTSTMTYFKLDVDFQIPGAD